MASIGSRLVAVLMKVPLYENPSVGFCIQLVSSSEKEKYQYIIFCYSIPEPQNQMLKSAHVKKENAAFSVIIFLGNIK